MKRIALLCVTGMLIGANLAWSEDDKADAKTPAALNFEMKSIDGEPVKLSEYHGNVVLIVNVASKCGLTKQYKELQALHETYADKGLSILGFPANNFGKQEPGTDEQIATFCEKNFGVEFDMFSKVSVKGDDQCDLYKFLTSKETNGEFAGPIKWNFTKFLIGRDGKVVARFEPRVKPDSKQVIEAIERELAKPDPTADEKEE
jgi:glutathione peroxidase